MKKIYLSVLIICATLISVMGIAYAYFTSTAVKMSGITLATGTPVLKISQSLTGEGGWLDTITGVSETNMFPGWEGSEHPFYIRNNSTGMGIAAIVPTITVTAGDWDILKGGVEARFIDATAGPGGYSTDWKTLADWQNNTTVSMINQTLVSNAVFSFTVQYRMPTGTTDNSVLQGKIISGMEWNFVGRTQ